MVDSELYSHSRHHDPGAADGRMAEARWIEGAKAARTRNNRISPAARLGNYADILVDSVLDVSPEDLPENLSRYRVLAPECACRSEFPNYSSHSAPKLAEGGVHEITVRKSATLSLLPVASFILSFI